MAAGVGQAQLTLDGNDIAGAIVTLDANGNFTVPYNSTSTPVGGHVISARFIPSGNQQSSSDPNGRNVQVDAPLVPTTTTVAPISPNEFPQGTIVSVTGSVVTNS